MCKASFAGDDPVGSGMSKTDSLSNDAISAERDRSDSFLGDDAQSKHQKCSWLDELDIIPELKEWLEGLDRQTVLTGDW